MEILSVKTNQTRVNIGICCLAQFFFLSHFLLSIFAIVPFFVSMYDIFKSRTEEEERKPFTAFHVIENIVWFLVFDGIMRNTECHTPEAYWSQLQYFIDFDSWKRQSNIVCGVTSPKGNQIILCVWFCHISDILAQLCALTELEISRQ